MIRPSGLYAVLAGEEIRVELHGRDYVKLAGAYDMVRHEMDELDDFLTIKTFATWRGGEISVSAVEGDECGFNSNDQGLAEREGLAGDFYSGWHGAAPLSEMTEVNEQGYDALTGPICRVGRAAQAREAGPVEITTPHKFVGDIA